MATLVNMKEVLIMSMILRYMTMSTGMIGNAMMAALLLIRMVDTMPTRGMDSRAVRNITTMANIMEGMMASGVRTTMICGKRGWQVVGGHHILLHLHGVLDNTRDTRFQPRLSLFLHPFSSLSNLSTWPSSCLEWH